MFLTGFICLILAVFSSHWWFIPLIGIMTLHVIVTNRDTFAPGRKARWVTIYDQKGNSYTFDESDINNLKRRGTSGRGPL